MLTDDSNPQKVTFFPSVEGRFYPSSPDELRRDLQSYLDAAGIEPCGLPVLCILSPHAGYVFSAPVAAYSFRYAERQNPDTVLFIALSHQGAASGCVADGKCFETPLGEIGIDRELTEALLASGDPFYTDRKPYIGEHSVEVNLPFVQHVFPNARVASILTSRSDPDVCRTIGQKTAQTIQQFPDKRVLICVSSDMSHYPDYESANRLDQAMLASLEGLNPRSAFDDLRRLESEPVSNLHCVMCGSSAMLTAMEASIALGASSAKTLHYRNSGDSPHGDRSRVVGYGAFAIHGKSETESDTISNESHRELCDDDRKELLQIARQGIEEALHHRRTEVSSANPHLKIERGVFVTLKNQGRLRGCLGRFDPNGTPLDRLVGIMAAESATGDVRFSSVSVDEVPGIDIVISVLSPLRKIGNISEIEIGKHGLKIIGTGRYNRGRMGTLLPQVAVERGWSVEEFLENTCIKANMATGAWKDGTADIYVYEAEVFGDLDYTASGE